jgi:hypothetical protein
MKGAGHCDRYCHFHVICARVVICAVFDREVERDVVASDEVSLEIVSIGALELFLCQLDIPTECGRFPHYCRCMVRL